MLEVRRLSLRYPNGTLALAEFDIAVKPGELVVVLGGNGSGKTTLMRCITRTLQPTDGSVRVNGTDLAPLAGEKLRRARLEPPGAGYCYILYTVIFIPLYSYNMNIMML